MPWLGVWPLAAASDDDLPLPTPLPVLDWYDAAEGGLTDSFKSDDWEPLDALDVV